MGGAVFPPCMVGVMLVMVTSFKVLMSVLLYSVPLTPCQAIVEPTSLLETPGHSQASLTWSLVRSLLLSPGSWCAQGFVCALQESFPPVLWKFCNQIPLAFKVKFKLTNWLHYQSHSHHIYQKGNSALLRLRRIFPQSSLYCWRLLSHIFTKSWSSLVKI